jgi:hypothetical protein
LTTQAAPRVMIQHCSVIPNKSRRKEAPREDLSGRGDQGGGLFVAAQHAGRRAVGRGTWHLHADHLRGRGGRPDRADPLLRRCPIDPLGVGHRRRHGRLRGGRDLRCPPQPRGHVGGGAAAWLPLGEGRPVLAGPDRRGVPGRAGGPLELLGGVQQLRPGQGVQEPGGVQHLPEQRRRLRQYFPARGRCATRSSAPPSW